MLPITKATKFKTAYDEAKAQNEVAQAGGDSSGADAPKQAPAAAAGTTDKKEKDLRFTR